MTYLVPSPEQSNKDDDDDRDENDEEVARSFDINKWLNDASNAILGPSKKDNLITPSTPPRLPPKPTAKSPPRRKPLPSSPPPDSPDHNLYKPPFGPKKRDQQPAAPPPPTTTSDTNEVDDFFS